MDLREIDEDIERNRRQRLEFITAYACWVKETPNEIWSGQQRELLDSAVRVADRLRREGVRVV